MNRMNRKLNKLFLILDPHESWWNNKGEEKNNLAKKALHDFYKALKKCKPSNKYEKRDMHMLYLPFLIRIKKAFMEEKYMRVCNELISLMYYEPELFFQKRIYNNVIKLLEEHLEIEKD